jgi:NAD(P)-dependent dehydrogenase (short-subunit alcohol dehydrogenase family)
MRVRELEGKVALVTGAGGAGCGGAIARIMAREGAAIVVMEKHERRCRETADEIAATHGVATVACAVDIADRSAVDAALRLAGDTVGPIDILVNNAAINVQGSIFDYDPADFDAVLAVDFVACWYLTRAVIGGMRDRGWGSIINVSSVAAYIGGAGIEAPYAASKAALHDLTRGTAVEGGPHGIRCNGIAVGLVRSKFLERDPDAYVSAIQQTPLRRVAEPDEIAEIALFLASERSAFITGEIINASGGLTLGQ